VDALLHFGNIRTGYRKLRSLTFEELQAFFSAKRFNAECIKDRGPALPLHSIAKDHRYLISEMACKSYGENGSGDLKQVLIDSFRKFRASSQGPVRIRDLLAADCVP
jgi:hypothetical protein